MCHKGQSIPEQFHVFYITYLRFLGKWRLDLDLKFFFMFSHLNISIERMLSLLWYKQHQTRLFKINQTAINWYCNFISTLGLSFTSDYTTHSCSWFKELWLVLVLGISLVYSDQMFPSYGTSYCSPMQNYHQPEQFEGKPILLLSSWHCYNVVKGHKDGGK